jgi:hypothetical protein
MLNKLYDASIIFTHQFGCNSLRIVHPRRLFTGILMQDPVSGKSLRKFSHLTMGSTYHDLSGHCLLNHFAIILISQILLNVHCLVKMLFVVCISK